MTRIDPNQLLTTMSVLLAPDGGIKSIEEVPRIVQLMHKFSKKLVSKCIYIHILRSSSPELLEQFLAKNGWELLNQWFFDAYTNGNLYLCGDLVRLFALCPMTGHRLKSDPSTNQAPRILRQLSTDTRIEAEIRNLATQVVHQWIRIARKKPLDDDYAAPDDDGADQGGDYYNNAEEEPVQEYDADHSEDYVPPVKTKKVDKKDGVAVKKTQGVKKVKAQPKPKNNALEKLKKKGDSKDNDSVDDLLDGTTSEDSDSDSADEMIERQKAMAAKRAALGTKKIADLTSVNKSPSSTASSKAKFEEREKEIRRRREAQEAKKRRAERAKPYSRTELRGDLEDEEKDRIKKIAAALKEQNKNKSKISSLGRIPKLPKKEVPATKSDVNSEAGFGAMLGALDTAKPKPKPSLTKNKNRDLLETLTAKPRSKADLEKEQKEKEKQIQERMKEDAKIEEKLKREEEEKQKIEMEKQKKLEEEKRLQEEKQAAKEKEAEKKEEKKRERKNSTSSNSSHSSDDERRERRRKEKEEERRKRKEKEEKRRKEKEREKEKERRDSNSSDKEKERSKDKKDKTKEKSKDEKEIKSKEERKGEKRSSTEEKQSVKKVKVIKESNMFGDILSSIMKDDKHKKKRRPSDKDKEMSKSKESEKDSSDNKKDEEKSAKSETAVEERLSPIREEQAKTENNSAPPREKKGILVYARGFKPKRSLRWANEMSLVQIEYFDLDETERANVFKQKLNFAERKKQEHVMEKNKMKHGGGGDEGHSIGHYEHEEKLWSLSRLDIEHPVEYGYESKERDVQQERETRVLTQLYFGNSMPSDPSEPDPMPKSAGTVEPKAIPQIDLTNTNSETDFTANGWTSKVQSPPPTAFDALIAAPITKSPSLDRTSPPTDHSAAPPQTSTTAAASKPPTNLQELLSSLKPGLLENIVNMANTISSSSSNNTSAREQNEQNSGRSTVSPTNDNNYHNNKPFNKSETAAKNRPKFSLPPPVNHRAPYPKGPQRGFESRGGHQSRDRDNWDNRRNDRNNHYNNHHQDNYHSGAGGRKVCNFFAKTGNCRFGDNCSFAHIPSDNQHNHNTRVH